MAGDTCADGVSICATVSECPLIISQMRKGIVPKVCGFESSKIVMCCPNFRPTLATSTTKRYPSNNGVIFSGYKKISQAARCNYDHFYTLLFHSLEFDIELHIANSSEYQGGASTSVP